MKRTYTTELQSNRPRKQQARPPQRKASMVNPQRKRGPKVEYKDFTVGSSLNPVLGSETEWTPAVSIFQPLISGGSNGRIGRKTTCLKVIMRYKVTTLAAAGATPPSQWRVRLFYDKQTNGAVPLMNSVMAPNSITGHPGLSNGDRFITVMDFITPLPQGAFSELAGVEKRNINLTTTFLDSNTGTITDIATGSFLLSCVSSNAESVDLIEMTTRFRYSDD